MPGVLPFVEDPHLSVSAAYTTSATHLTGVTLAIEETDEDEI